MNAKFKKIERNPHPDVYCETTESLPDFKTNCITPYYWYKGRCMRTNV